MSNAKRSGNYNDIRHEAEKPLRNRKAVIESRTGQKKKPRRYHMSNEKAADLRRQFKKTGVFPNPYRRTGIYHGIVQALISLGLNKTHSFADLKSEIKRVMEQIDTPKSRTAWDNFTHRKPKNPYTAKDINGRIIENTAILQRITGLNPFGEKLRQLHACIDVFCNNDGLPEFRLNTSFQRYEDVKPINELRKKRKK